MSLRHYLPFLFCVTWPKQFFIGQSELNYASSAVFSNQNTGQAPASVGHFSRLRQVFDVTGFDGRLTGSTVTRPTTGINRDVIVLRQSEISNIWIPSTFLPVFEKLMTWVSAASDIASFRFCRIFLFGNRCRPERLVVYFILGNIPLEVLRKGNSSSAGGRRSNNRSYSTAVPLGKGPLLRDPDTCNPLPQRPRLLLGDCKPHIFLCGHVLRLFSGGVPSLHGLRRSEHHRKTKFLF